MGFMRPAFNIYCDESCHLEHDGQPIMVLGAVTCPKGKARQVAKRIRDIKIKHRLPANFEIKWSKVSRGKGIFYQELLDYFFEEENLGFRAIVVSDKSKLKHTAFGQTHDTFYYKLYFDLLKVLLEPNSEYYIYLDIKDSRSAEKTRKLHDVLSKNMYDFERSIVRNIQVIRSHEVEQAQLADLLIGIVGYANRGLKENIAKYALVTRMRKRSHYQLTRTTLLRERKVNLFLWSGSEVPA